MDIKILLMIACFNGVVLIFNVVMISRWRIKMGQQGKAYRYIEQLNKELRYQRHDFLNHMQVAFGLMELKEYEEASRYLNKLYGEINRLNANIKTSKVAVNALLQAKSNEAEQKGIHYYVSISTSLSDIKMEEWQLCGCLSNLIDNAFEACLGYEEEACVWVRIYEEMGDYVLEVDNTGERFSPEEIDRVFEEGYSSKGQEGHGLGLFIVRKTLKNYGEVKASSAEHGMVFTIRLKR